MATILVVDDEPQILKITESMLTRAGHTVYTAPNGLEAMSIIMAKAEWLDVIVSDLNMPEVDGYTLYIWITKEFPELMLKFVFHTSNPDELDNYNETVLVRKMDKPSDPGVFMNTIDEILIGKYH